MRVVVGDAHQIYSVLLAELVRKAGHSVLWQGCDLTAAVREADRHAADVCLLGLAGSSLEPLENLPHHSTPVVLILPKRASRLIPNSRRLGIAGLATRDDSVHEIIAVATKAVTRSQWQEPGVVLSARTTVAGQSFQKAAGVSLTEREREILELLEIGATTSELVQKLEVKVSTVRTHIASILQKLQVHSRAEAVVAYEMPAVVMANRRLWEPSGYAPRPAEEWTRTRSS